MRLHRTKEREKEKGKIDQLRLFTDKSELLKISICLQTATETHLAERE
jgi:hypothetical protein